MSSTSFIESLKNEISANGYDDNSIARLEGEERVRKRPEALLGSKGIDGAKHTIVEIIGNATDERLSGFGDKLDVTLHEDNSISVRDYGRGVPLGWNEKAGDWNYYLIYEELYAGGKYGDDKKQDVLRKIDEANAWDGFHLLDFPGMVSIGLNGLGAAATQCSSSFCEVVSYRDGKASRMKYEGGKHVLDELEVTDTDEPNGTLVHWKPDDAIFTDTNIPSRWLRDLCKKVSYVSGFTVTYTHNDKSEVYEGKSLEQEMLDSVEYAVGSNNMVHMVDNEGDICVCEAEVILGSSGRGSEYFHNKVEVRGGVHSTSFNTAVAVFFDGLRGEYNIRFKETDYAGKISIISSTLSNKMSVRGQTKDYVDDQFIYICLYDCILNILKQEYAKGNPWLMKVVHDAVENAHNRIALAEMSKNLQSVERTIKRHKASEKFTSCEAYENGKVDEVECFIVEGDSAGGRVKTARNAYYQCLLAIRGKSLNVYKATIEKLVANKEIRDMIAMLGCGIDLGIDGYESFDIKKLKVGKIIFLADADIDGNHILMLLFLIFYKLFPVLLYEGKVYVAETPLYVINCKDNSSVFCMNEDELAEKRKEIGEENIYSVDRFKGLGETEADVLWDTTLNPETRVLRQIKLERNDMELTDVLEVLFGKSTARRKQAILGSMIDNFDEVLDENENLFDMIDGMNLEDSLDIEEVEY